MKQKKRKEGRDKTKIKRETEKEKVKKGEEKTQEKQRETQRNKQKCPFLGEKQFFLVKTKKGGKKQKQKNKEGLGPGEVALLCHLTWPLNPPKNKTKNNKKKTKQKLPQNELFSYQSNFSFLGGWFIWQLGPTSAHPQNNVNIGVQPTFFEKHMRHDTAIFGQKQSPEIPVIIFLAFFFSLNNKTQTFAETPIVIVVLQT